MPRHPTTRPTGGVYRARRARFRRDGLDWSDILISTAITGAVASVASAVALAGLARMAGAEPLQPTNATSHWLHGPGAGRVARADLAHTGVGYVTHHASTMFWALPFEIWLASRPPRRPGALLRDAAAMAAIAAAVDYGLVPRRLTPGWETVLGPPAIAAAYAALAIGLAGGASLSRTMRARRF